MKHKRSQRSLGPSVKDNTVQGVLSIYIQGRPTLRLKIYIIPSLITRFKLDKSYLEKGMCLLVKWSLPRTTPYKLMARFRSVLCKARASLVQSWHLYSSDHPWLTLACGSVSSSSETPSHRNTHTSALSDRLFHSAIIVLCVGFVALIKQLIPQGARTTSCFFYNFYSTEQTVMNIVRVCLINICWLISLLGLLSINYTGVSLFFNVCVCVWERSESQ